MGKRRIDKSNVVKALKEIKTEDKHNPSNTKSNRNTIITQLLTQLKFI